MGAKCFLFSFKIKETVLDDNEGPVPALIPYGRKWRVPKKAKKKKNLRNAKENERKKKEMHR